LLPSGSGGIQQELVVPACWDKDTIRKAEFGTAAEKFAAAANPHRREAHLRVLAIQLPLPRK